MIHDYYYYLNILMKQKEKDFLEEVNGIRLAHRDHSSRDGRIWQMLHIVNRVTVSILYRLKELIKTRG